MGFSGLADVLGVRAEGVAMGADALASAISSANAQAEEPVRRWQTRPRFISRRASRRPRRCRAHAGNALSSEGDFPG